MIWFDVDTALGEVPVNVAPLTDDTDFKSIETAVAYNASGMSLYWHFVTTTGSYTATAVTPTTGGSYDWAHQQQGMYTIEIPASGGASINNDTEGYGWFTGVCTGVLPWRGPTIGFRAAAINDAMIDGGDNLDVNVTQFGGSNGTFSGGRPEVNATHFAGTAYATALAAEVDAVWDEAISGHTTAGTTGKAVTDILADTGTDGVVVAAGSKTGYSLSATQTFDLTGNITGNLSGSVGSVTGAVGSVMGNVGGNVAGSVGSVTAGVTVTTNNDKTGYTLSATGSAALTEGYAALGAAGTLPQILYEIRALLAEKSISSTTLTTKKLDGSTTAATYTLDDATTPSAITRAT